MIRTIIIITICLTTALSIDAKSKAESTNYPFYVGTYTNGASQGIYEYQLNKDGTLDSLALVAKTENPNFLAFSNNHKYLVACNATGNDDFGGVASFKVEKDKLVKLSRQSSGGKGPCHVATNAQNFVVVSNYGAGSAGLLKLNEDGSLSSLLYTAQHQGSGPTNRQKQAHAHSANFIENGNAVIINDLGTDELWFYNVDEKSNQLKPLNRLKMNAGAGPRHLAFHPNKKWIYVVNELDCTVSQIKKTKEGTWKLGNSASTLPPNFKDKNTCAEIQITSDGKFLYASNRGHNSIAMYAVNKKDGSLKTLGWEPTKGETPRNFSISPKEDFVIVANKNSDNLVAFKRNAKTGLLQFTDEIMAPAPVCLLFKD